MLNIRKQISILLGFFFIFVSTSNSNADIFCKLNFVSLEFPKVEGCHGVIDAFGEFELGTGCKNASNGTKNKMKLAGKLLVRWLGESTNTVDIVIKDSKPALGYISGIGNPKFAGSNQSMIEMTKQVKLVDIDLNDLNLGKITGRYPAAIAGMKLSQLPYPHGYIFIDINNGKIQINNEFGSFILKGKCNVK